MKTIDMIYAVHDDARICIESKTDGILYTGTAKDLNFDAFKKIVNRYSTVEYIKNITDKADEETAILIEVRKDIYAK